MKAVVYQGPFNLGSRMSRTRRSSSPATRSSGSRPRTSAVRTCTPTRAGRRWRRDGARAREHGHRRGGRAGVNRVKVGDRVSVPFNLACGTCRNCIDGWTSSCLRANPPGAAAPGTATRRWARTGAARPSTCGCRGPTSTCSSCRRGRARGDFTMLRDIFPTGYHGTELAGVGPGQTVAVFGAGPVGLMAAHSAFIRGAAQVFVVDQQRRPARAGREDRRHAGRPRRERSGRGDHGRHRRFRRRLRRRGRRLPGARPGRAGTPGLVLDNLVQVVRATGAIGVVGVYARGPRRRGEGAKHGRYGFDYGTVFTKGIRMGTGQCPVKRYNRQLRDLIIAGRATPSRSSPTSCRWTRRPTPTTSSTSA